MFVIKQDAEIEIVQKKSKFITRIMKVKSEKMIKNIINETRKNEKGAVHNCFAYRILDNNNKINERKSDDGEPGGTAGAPMLAVLAGENVVNALAVTTRYFGGIKLGTGGLVNVYKKGVKEVLKKCGLVKFEITSDHLIVFPINYTDQVNYYFKKHNIEVVDRKFDVNVVFKVRIVKNDENKLHNLAELYNGKFLVEP